MNRRYVIHLIIILLCVFFVGVVQDSRTVMADSLSSKMKSAQRSVSSNDEARKPISDISKDAMDIIRYILMGLFTCSLLWSTASLNSATTPQKQAFLRNLIIFDLLGIIFMINIYGLLLYLFGIEFM